MKTEWWLQGASFPDLVWARIAIRDDGCSEVLEPRGGVTQFQCYDDAQSYLSEDGYVPLEEIRTEPTDLEIERLGANIETLAPPTGSTHEELITNLIYRRT
jgi:hypothetical protein